MHVSAKDKGTGKEQSMTITGGSGLPKDEIDRMVKEAEAHEAEDKKRKEDAETRNQAESFAYQTEKLVNDNKDKLSDDVAKEVTDKVNELKEALKGEDIEKIKSAQTELMTSARRSARPSTHSRVPPTPPVRPALLAPLPTAPTTTWLTPKSWTMTTRTTSNHVRFQQGRVPERPARHG
mgnify:CR=1 FL=1